MTLRYFFFLSFLLSCTQISAQTGKANRLIQSMDSLIQHKDYFHARDLLQQHGSQFTPHQALLYGAFIDNAFNRLQASNDKIKLLFEKYEHLLSPAMQFQLLEIQQANHGKLFEYKSAWRTIDLILSEHRDALSKERLEDFKNTGLIWRALASSPKQTVTLEGDTRIQMKRDKAQLHNLPVSNGSEDRDFIFDTGANLSTVTESTAKWLNIKVVAKKIAVTSITGEKIWAKIGVCPQFTIGNIEVRNSVCIIFPDKDLAFKQIDYQIHGIIGFPVLEAMEEIQITREDEFIVPVARTGNHVQNMAIDFLTPIFQLDGDSYTFDTGASQTFLYPLYFEKFRKEIEQNYDQKVISYGGAGGTTRVKGYAIPFEPVVEGRKLHLADIPVLTEETGKASSTYFFGNIGQDLIRQFDKMILNFDEMFIGFEGYSGN